MNNLDFYYLTPIHVLVFGAIYYILVYRFLEGVVIRRLTKTSFRIGLTDCLDLSIAYNLCIISCLYYSFHHSSIDMVSRLYNITILDFPVYTLDEKNSSALIASISALIFIGRIITKAKGCFFAKIHFSAIFIATSIYIAIDILTALSNTHSIELLYYGLYFRIKDFLDFYNTFGYLPIVCSLLLVTICEIVLSITPPTSKSIMIVSDKFPSDFRVITGRYQFMTRLKRSLMSNEAYLVECLKLQRSYSEIKRYCTESKMKVAYNPDLEKNIFRIVINYYNKLSKDDGVNVKLYDMLYPSRHKLKKITCVTRSLVMIDVVTSILAETLLLKKVEVRVIIAPPSTAIRDFEQGMKQSPWSIGNFIRYKKWEIEEYKKRYCKRYRKFREYQLDGVISAMEYYLGNTVFVIVEYEDDEKELLFSIRDSGSMKKRVGLFTKEPHVIAHFESMFGDIWRNGYKC